MIEHIFTTSVILPNAREHKLPLYMTFLDISNDFGSIPHQVISDMLNHINVPNKISQYESHAYSQLKAFVSSAHWTTEQFQIERGVFQGGTLSPLIFLVTFNPIIALANSKLKSGYSLHHPVPSSVGLPPVGTHIYIEWNEPTSDEPLGWYRCSVSSYTLSGQSIITYPNSNTETINLNSVTWHLATGNSRHFLPFHHAPPNAKVPKIRAKLESQKYTAPLPPPPC